MPCLLLTRSWKRAQLVVAIHAVTNPCGAGANYPTISMEVPDETLASGALHGVNMTAVSGSLTLLEFDERARSAQ